MAYLSRRVLKKKHYAIYTEAKDQVKTKARLLKEALGKALKEDEHAKFIDFIPAKFTLQLHGWFEKNNEKGYTELGQIQTVIRIALKSEKDPLKVLKGKWHYDLRIQKSSAPTWFGLTPFRAPWTGTVENKVLGTVKGYQSIVPGGKKLGKFLMERAEKEMAKEGIAERRDRIEWMKIKAQWFKPDSPGNPQKYQDAAMIAIEFYKPACLHRRELDFFDITFFGDHLKGRYYNRLVERKIKESELMEWQKKAKVQGKIKDFFIVSFYFWKAKKQWGDPKSVYSMKDVFQAALEKRTLDRILAPPKKK